MKRLITAILAVAMIMTAGVTSFAASEYKDLKSTNWAYKAVDAMTMKAIVKGYPDGTFRPNNTVTYGEFIKMALIADTGKDVGNAATGNWATNYYNEAVINGYFTRSDINDLQLNQPIPRADMALIVSQVLGYVKIDDFESIQKGITDVSEDTKHEDSIVKAYAAGVLTGYPDNTFKPDRTLTRAESATVIYRLVDEGQRVVPEQKDEILNAQDPKIVNTADYFDVNSVYDVTVQGQAIGDFTAKAELYTDGSQFDIQLGYEWDGEVCAFTHKLNGFLYLIKNGKIIDDCRTLPRYDEAGNFLYSYVTMPYADVETADYIICVDMDGVLTKIVKNPLKTK